MKILIVQPRISYYIGGGEKVPIRHAEYLSKRDNEVHLFTIKSPTGKDSFLYERLKKDAPQVSIKEFDLPAKFLNIYDIPEGENRERWDVESLAFCETIKYDIEVLRPDVILSYYLLDGLFKPPRTKNVLYLLGYPDDKNSIRKSLFYFYDKIVFISQNTKDKWREEVGSLAGGPVIHTGVDIPIFNQIEKKGLGGNGKSIVFAGRLIERKGVEILMKAFRQLSVGGPLNLYILGDGPLLPKLKEMAAQLNGDHKVIFTGSTPDVFEYFSSADICVFPSYGKEGLMGVVMEAMTSGGAVITTRENGNEEIITSGSNGLLIPPRDEHALANSMRGLLVDDFLRNSIKEEAKKYARDNFSWEKSVGKLENVLA